MSENNIPLNDIEDEFPYEDIVDMPYRPSDKRRHMTMEQRAAQFAPFAALSTDDEPDNT